MSASRPTVVLVHGSWHSPEHFAPLEANLLSCGYKTHSVWLPTMHYSRLNPPLDPAKITLLDDILAVRTAIAEELSNNPTTDVAVLSHSYGTVPASAAIENLDKLSRTKKGHRNGVTGFLIIAGLLVPADITLLDWAGGQIPPTVAISTIPDLQSGAKAIQVSNVIADPGPIALFYHDVPDEKHALKYAELCTHQIWSANTTVIPFAAWRIPSLAVFYLVAEEDRALPPGFQRIMIESANRERAAAGGVEGSAAEHGGDMLEKFQKDSLAGIEASRAILEGVKAGETGGAAAVGAEEGIGRRASRAGIVHSSAAWGKQQTG